MTSMISKLSNREKRMIYAAGGVFILILLIQFMIILPSRKNADIDAAIARKKNQLLEMRIFEAEYKDAARNASASQIVLKNRRRGFTLFSFLDGLSGRVGVKDSIAYMKPSSRKMKSGRRKISTVEMKMAGVTMKQALNYLYGVETSKDSVYIKKMVITQAGRTKGLIDVVLQVETLEI